jgi:chloramphenicol-sensitive protein RarD
MNSKVGYYQAFGAYFIWGVFPIYWKYLKHIESLEILVHRVIWSFVFLFLINLIMKKANFSQLFLILKKQLPSMLLLAGLIASNWLIYVYAVNSNQILQGSLAYFMTPLLNIALGALLFGEKLSRQMKIAASVAAFGVFILMISNSTFPWIAISLAASFSTYGVIKKKVQAGGLESSLLENFVMLVPAFLAALYFREKSKLALNSVDWTLLILSGAVTASPILLFSLSARVIPFNHTGILQFLAPTLQFIIGYFIFSEPVSNAKMWAFVFVWIGVGLYIQQILKKQSLK